MSKSSLYVVITPYFPTLEQPWNCAFLSDQVRAIQRTGRYDVIVINPISDKPYKIHGIDVVGFRQITSGRWICPPLFDLLNKRRLFNAISRHGVSISRTKIIHGHLVTCAPYVLALANRVRSAVTLLQFHDADPYGMLLGSGRFGWIKRIIYFIYYRSLARRIDLLISISRNVERVVKEAPHQTVFNTYAPMKKAMHSLRWFRKLEIRNSYVLHNGIDQRLFEKETGGDGRDSARFVIGCVGVFRDLKDQITLLKAIKILEKEIKGLVCKLVGMQLCGTMKEECEAYIAEHNLPVERIDAIQHEDLGPFYRSLDLFVLPSYFEGFGCVFVEANACGVPFITCQGQGMDDLIAKEDRDIWLCRQQDPVDLADKIRNFYINRPKQTLSENIDIDYLIPRFLDFVENMKRLP